VRCHGRVLVAHTLTALARATRPRAAASGHTKSQRIHGEVALALPASDCTTVWLDMNDGVRREHQLASERSHLNGPKKTLNVEMTLQRRSFACSVQRTYCSWAEGDGGPKMRTLLQDLCALRDTDAQMHAVVFTHHVESYTAICHHLRRAGFDVCGFTGTTVAHQRHETIRRFQQSVEQRTPGVSRVFVATLKVGNVGITLTAATRVYIST
jgi:superfamily II DNA/RNA helicase